MPELPEVETVARGLQYLAGRKLRALELFDLRVWFESEEAPETLEGLMLREVSRRGKYLLLRFERNLTLVQHLRMTGKMLEAGSIAVPGHIRAAAGTRVGKGLQIRCRFQFQGFELWFYDTRRFGTLTLVADEEAYFLKKKVAPDPFHEPVRAREWFLDRLAKSGKPAKVALLDQQIVAGVGNIYADEALHRVGVHPLTPARKVLEPAKLWAAIVALLTRSIELGGSTIRDYVSATGEAGSFASEHLVYGRAGEPCGGCGATIRRIVLSGRATHFCAACQPQVSGKKRPIQGGSLRGQSPARGSSAKLRERPLAKRRSPR
jgi:formamidopyrimidine-DNA glycosylase